MENTVCSLGVMSELPVSLPVEVLKCACVPHQFGLDGRDHRSYLPLFSFFPCVSVAIEVPHPMMRSQDTMGWCFCSYQQWVTSGWPKVTPARGLGTPRKHRFHLKRLRKQEQQHIKTQTSALQRTYCARVCALLQL